MLVINDFRKNTSQDLMKMHYMANKIIGYELKAMLNPCYRPKLTKYWNDLFDCSGLTLNDTDILKKSISKKYDTIRVVNDKYTLFLFLFITNMLRHNRIETAKLFYLLLSIKFYSNLVHKHFPVFCVPEVWDKALQAVSAKHLFKTRQGVASTVLYLSYDEFRKQYLTLKSDSVKDDDLVRSIYALRNRISQSIKSFAETYYELHALKGKVSTTDDQDELSNVTLLSDRIANSISTYGQVDQAAFIKAVSMSGIRQDTGSITIKNLSEPEFREKIKFIIILMSRLSDMKEICSEIKRHALIRKILSNKKIGDYSVREEIKNLLFLLDNAYELKNMDYSQIVLFFSHYLTLYIKNRFCY